MTCRALGFSMQAFYAWKKQPLSARDWDEAHLINAALDIHRDDPAFGYRFIADELAGRGLAARAHRPRRGHFRVGRDRGPDQGCRGMSPLAGHVRSCLVDGDGLHQTVHEHDPVSRRGDQGIAPQRGDRIAHGERVAKQQPQGGSGVWGEVVGGLRIGEQHCDRDRFGCQAGQQPQQPYCGGAFLAQPGQGQAQGGGRTCWVPGSFAAGQHLRTAVPEHREVPAQGCPGGLDVGGGLLQRQRQSAQLPGKGYSSLVVWVAAAADEEVSGDRGAKDVLPAVSPARAAPPPASARGRPH